MNRPHGKRTGKVSPRARAPHRAGSAPGWFKTGALVYIRDPNFEPGTKGMIVRAIETLDFDNPWYDVIVREHQGISVLAHQDLKFARMLSCEEQVRHYVRMFELGRD